MFIEKALLILVAAGMAGLLLGGLLDIAMAVVR